MTISSDIGGDVLGFTDLWMKAAGILITCFAVIFFVLKYGIRGFAFTDVFQTPIIALSVLLLVGGTIWLANDASISMSSSLIQPLVDAKTIILFVIHSTF